MIAAKYEATNTYVVIVGSNSGIGQVLIKQLIAYGTTIFGLDIQESSATPISDRNYYFQADSTNSNEVENVLKQIKKYTTQINGLVNLAGTILQFKPIEELSIADWNETYDISFKSCFNSCRIFMPLLKKSTGAAIVNMSSGLAFIGQLNYGPYAAGKASVISFSKTLAAETAPSIRVNTVAPGAVDTGFIYKKDGSTRFNKQLYTKMVPLGAIAKPEEISSVVLFLLSNGASHMTGQCLHVNGGASMH